jgi:hypothetical protein
MNSIFTCHPCVFEYIVKTNSGVLVFRQHDSYKVTGGMAQSYRRLPHKFTLPYLLNCVKGHITRCHTKKKDSQGPHCQAFKLVFFIEEYFRREVLERAYIAIIVVPRLEIASASEIDKENF